VGDEHDNDPDRAAILARRRRFIALAISGLAATGCKGPGPQACLSIEQPPDPDDPQPEPESGMTGPIVEDPGAPLESGETGGEDTGETGEVLEETRPETCLLIAPDPQPRPCLRKRRPNPQPCLMVY
jgi:hypothetical protein